MKQILLDRLDFLGLEFKFNFINFFFIIFYLLFIILKKKFIELFTI